MVLLLSYFQVYEMRDAGAVIHSHGMESCIVTMILPFSKEFRVIFCTSTSYIVKIFTLAFPFFSSMLDGGVILSCLLDSSFPT